MTSDTRKAIIAAVIRAEPPDGSTLPDAIDRAILSAIEIEREADAIRRADAEEAERQRRAIREMANRLVALRRRCHHPATTRHMGTGYDPSYQTCNLCGAEIDR